MTGKRSIPLELLRRSTRTSGKDIVKKDEAVDERSCQKGIKREHSASVDAKDEVIKVNSKPNITLEPDGFLNVDEYELDLERTLLGGQSFRWTKVEDKQVPIFTGVVGDRALQLWRPAGDKIAFRTLATSPTKTELTTTSTQTMLADYFQLKYNLKELYEKWASADKHLANCCKQYSGFRILRQDPVENLFSFICATNNNIKRISQMIDKLCHRYGNILRSRDESQSIYESFKSFPPVERLASEEVFQCLRYELGFGYRAKFINNTAQQVLELSSQRGLSARDYLLSLRSLPYKETRNQLMQFQGIGRKVADCISLMSMDHLESVPIDCHIYEIVTRHYMPNLSKQHKTLTEKVHDLIGDYFNDLHGPLAGWSTSVLFIAELKHLKQQDATGGGDSSRKKKKRGK